MIRTQIQLSETQHERLRALAHEQRMSLAAVIRALVDEKLSEHEGSRARLLREAMAVVGRHADPSGTTDAAVRHDRHLAEAYAAREEP